MKSIQPAETELQGSGTLLDAGEGEDTSSCVLQQWVAFLPSNHYSSLLPLQKGIVPCNFLEPVELQNKLHIQVRWSRRKWCPGEGRSQNIHLTPASQWDSYMRLPPPHDAGVGSSGRGHLIMSSEICKICVGGTIVVICNAGEIMDIAKSALPCS